MNTNSFPITIVSVPCVLKFKNKIHSFWPNIIMVESYTKTGTSLVSTSVKTCLKTQYAR